MLSRKTLVFVSSGGMGSSFLAKAIPRTVGAPCIEKPFVNSFFFEDYPAPIRALYPTRPVLSDPNAHATAEVCQSFQHMQDKFCSVPARFDLAKGISMEKNMIDYIHFLNSRGIACVLRGSSCSKLLSFHGIKGVCFLIRHPVQAYISYGKPARHERDIDVLGGMEATEALNFWAWSWNCVAREYIRCLESKLSPVLLRYEFMEADLETSGSAYLKKVFSDFSESRNEEHITNDVQQALKELVRDYYYRIYDSWQLPK